MINDEKKASEMSKADKITVAVLIAAGIIIVVIALFFLFAPRFN
jgi:uncharacterized membrane protein